MGAPIKHTCPDIDRAIKLADEAIKIAEYAMKHVDKSSDEYDWFREIINNIEDIEPILEDLRTANAMLREYGEALEVVVNDYEERFPEPIEIPEPDLSTLIGLNQPPI